MEGIQLGDQVRDKLTGQKGTVVGKSYWLYGCVRLSVQPFGEKDGKAFDVFHADEPQCEVVKDGKVKKPKPAHGPRPDATRRPDVATRGTV